MTTDKPFPRDERHYCPTCGQHYAVHTNFPPDASEPPAGWRCKEVADDEQERPDKHAEAWAEYEDNHGKERRR